MNTCYWNRCVVLCVIVFTAGAIRAGEGACDCGAMAVSVQRAAVANRATTNVGATEYQFNASNISIFAGDTVTWTNTGTLSHTTTSDTGLWDMTLAPGQNFSFTFANAGTFNYHCKFHGATKNMVGSVTVTIATAPSITSNLTAAGVAGVTFNYAIAATGTQPIVYGATGIPTGLSLSGNTLSGIPASPGTSNITLTATNAGGMDSKVLVLTVSPGAGTIPVIGSPLGANGTVGTAFTYTITATGTTPITFGAAPLPNGLTFNPATATISGTPAVGSAAQYSVTLSAVNIAGGDSKIMTLVISFAAPPPPAGPPVVTSAGSASGTVGVPFSFAITATNSPSAFVAANLPPGLSINTSTGLISGTPTSPGTSTVSLTVGNSVGPVSGTLSIAIAAAPPPPVGAVPQITSALTAVGSPGVPFSYQIAASNTPSSFGADSLPQGLTINTATGVISGTPLLSGSANVTLTATNSAGNGTATLVLNLGTGYGITPGSVDTDGDGVPDIVELMAGTDPLNPADAPIKGGTASASKPSATINFANSSRCTIKLTLKLALPDGYVNAGTGVGVIFGGVSEKVVLNPKGIGPRGPVSVKLKGAPLPKGGAAAQPAPAGAPAIITFSVGNKDETSGLAGAGMENRTTAKSGEPVSVYYAVTIESNGKKYWYPGESLLTLTYTAKEGKSGKLK